MKISYKESFEYWLKYFLTKKSKKDEKTLLDLKSLATNEKELITSFSGDLKFGTAGLRGTMGLGTNKLNIYTVRKATQGLSNYLLAKASAPSAAISFDSRINSELFAQEAAAVLAANGIKVFITKELSPTPFLSFIVRELKCDAGIMITASHNPAEYNGYKCYSKNGAQMVADDTEKVYEQIEKLDIFKDVRLSEFKAELEQGRIEFVPEEIYKKYIEKVLNQAINKEFPSKCNINITYTPLNGAGKEFVERVLSLSGVKNLSIVKEQQDPDGNFPTCKYPNPEIKEVFEIAIKNAKKVSSDLIIATDPDSDRLGLAVLNKGNYEILSGNQIGIILFYYLISQKKEKNLLPKNPVLIRTFVSSHMVDAIAKDYGCEVICVPTGFKNIGQKIFEMQINNKEDSFLFGFEESNGYLIGTYTRDKDAVSASMLLCEMASFYKEKGITLIDLLNKLYEKYGFYLEKTLSFEFKGVEGTQKINSIMKGLRTSSNLNTIGGKKVVNIKDYQSSFVYDALNNKKTKLNFPSLDVIEFLLYDGSSIVVRPSGTEPKIKIYIMTFGKDEISAKLSRDTIETDFCKKILN